MSAYIVSNETINKIVSRLQSDQGGKWLLNSLEQSEGLTLKYDEDFKQLARAIFLLNVQAVNQRYGESDSGTTVLYKTLTHLASSWAEDIVSKLDAYEKAPWG